MLFLNFLIPERNVPQFPQKSTIFNIDNDKKCFLSTKSA